MKINPHSRSSALAALLAALAQLASLNHQPAQAQTPTPDDFNPGANGAVYALAVQTDGKILVGGGLARLTPDGALDTSFSPGTDWGATSLAIHPNGKIVAASPYLRPPILLGWLTPDGSSELTVNWSGWLVLFPIPYPAIYTLALQPDGKLLYAGWLPFQDGTNSIGRQNADFTYDSGFSGGIEYDISNYGHSRVYALAVQPDGKILVGGDLAAFTSAHGWEYVRYGTLQRLNPDGSRDAGFKPYFDKTVYTVVVQPDGKILVGGAFRYANGYDYDWPGLVRLNADGTLDQSFGGWTYGVVWSLALQTDQKILVGGDFTTLNDQPRNHIGRLDQYGNLDSAFNPGADASVYSLALQADGRILVGGAFSKLGGETRNCLGRLNNTSAAAERLDVTGSTITWWRSGTSPEVWCTTFESWTGSAWTNLGAGTRIPGGWRLTGASVPTNGTVRARGYVTGGAHNASAWPVESSCGVPLVTCKPTNCTNNAGTAAIFTAAALGSGPLSFRWVKDGIPLTDGGTITGSETATLTLNNVSGRDIGAYCVIVSNALGSATSAVLLLWVTNPETPPRIIVNDGQFGFGPNGFGFNLLGSRGQVIVVEGSSNLLNWLPLRTNTLNTPQLYFSDPTAVGTSRQFYRARIVQ